MEVKEQWAAGSRQWAVKRKARKARKAVKTLKPSLPSWFLLPAACCV
jgi:hypothetical protein